MFSGATCSEADVVDGAKQDRAIIVLLPDRVLNAAESSTAIVGRTRHHSISAGELLVRCLFRTRYVIAHCQLNALFSEVDRTEMVSSGQVLVSVCSAFTLQLRMARSISLDHLFTGVRLQFRTTEGFP